MSATRAGRGPNRGSRWRDLIWTSPVWMAATLTAAEPNGLFSLDSRLGNRVLVGLEFGPGLGPVECGEK